MYNKLKENVLADIKEKYNREFKINNEIWNEALKETQKDILFNLFIFRKDVSYEMFIERLYIYLNMVERSL